MRVRQAAPPGLELEPREGDGGLEASVVARRRGRHVLPAVAARATGPLGLARCDHTAGGAAEVRVFPDLHTRAGSRSPSRAGASETRARPLAGRSASAPSSS